MSNPAKLYEVKGSIDGAIEPVEALSMIIGMNFSASIWANDEYQAQTVIEMAYGGKDRVHVTEVVLKK